jgi:formate hydrogenlyase subunit 3/multisubunit Na+/H+ antiporter MnhD subunit
MDSILLLPIVLPTIAGLACLVLPQRVKFMRELLALVSTVITVVLAAYILTIKDLQFTVFWLALGSDLTVQFDLLAGHFGSFILLAVSIFALLVTVYSLKYMADHARHAEHYAYLLLTLGMAAGAALANNLLVFLLFWDLLAVLLYAMVSLGGEEAMPGANKTLIIIGAADLALLLGIAFLWLSSGTLTISELTATPQILAGWLPTAAFLLIMVGAFAKAGAIPLHSWIPAISETAPIPVMAYLPAALDKLLGIYLLARISLHLFVMTPGVGLVLMVVGSVTIMGAVLMALIQGDFRKMLSFHAVSQVGYMVLGIGTGTPVGAIGGVFHMLNHAIYKSCLFLCGGSVQRQTGRTKFSELGGLAGAMPWTFITCLIAALAISGIPPFNGFASKWMVYQGILDRGGALFPLFLLAAMFGSGLTLASFVKLLYSMFWGDRPKGLERVTESSWTMLVPLIILAFLCLAFGVYYLWPVSVLISPILSEAGIQAVIPGIWQSSLATVLLILSLIVGFLFYLGGRARGAVETEVFLGGEALDPEVYRVPGTQFYGPIKGLAGLKQLYERGERGAFDLYRYLVGAITWGARVLYQYIDQALSDLYREVLPALLDLIGQILRLFNTRLLLTYALWAAYVAGIVVTLWLPGGRALSPSGELLLNATRTLAIVGMLGWGLLALVETDLRRFLVFAASSQFGFVLLGATISWAAALAYLVSASVAFVVIFLCCGSISRTMRTSEIEAMEGLSGRMPGRFLVFLIAALWLSGLPPFGNFFSKYLLGVAAHEVNLFFSLAITTAAILTLGYFLRPLRRFLHTAD